MKTALPYHLLYGRFHIGNMVAVRRHKANDTNRIHCTHYKVSSIKLKPFAGKVGIVLIMVVIVLKQFAHQ